MSSQKICEEKALVTVMMQWPKSLMNSWTLWVKTQLKKFILYATSILIVNDNFWVFFNCLKSICNVINFLIKLRGKSLPWLTPKIKTLMQEREYYHKKASKTNNKVHWSGCKWLCNAVNLKPHKEKNKYYSTCLSDEQDLKEMFKTVNQIQPGKSKTTNKTENLSATNLNEFFTTHC